MENTLNDKVKQSIQILRDKQARIYFLVQDTKGLSFIDINKRGEATII